MMMVCMILMYWVLLAGAVDARSINLGKVNEQPAIKVSNELGVSALDNYLVIRISNSPWTRQQIIELQDFFGVSNILDPGTLYWILLLNKFHTLYDERRDLYDVLVRIIAAHFVPYVLHPVISMPTLGYYELNALLLAGANPQPHFDPREMFWPALQWYIMAGEQYFPSLELLFKFGAKPDFIAYNGACTAMDFALWEFWKYGEMVVKMLLRHGANPNMVCPDTTNPNFLYDQQWPRKVYIGFFTGYTPVDMAIISVIEQYYYYLVFDPHQGVYKRYNLINTCQNIIDILGAAGGCASSKIRLQNKLDDLVVRLKGFYGKPSNKALNNVIEWYVDAYGL